MGRRGTQFPDFIYLNFFMRVDSLERIFGCFMGQLKLLKVFHNPLIECDQLLL
jgi:hypothetical protein